MRYILSILLLISLATGPASNAQRLIFKTYTVEDGLVSNPVRRVFQDSKGFIWITTWEGLSKYDGHKFNNYNSSNGLSHNVVNDICESADGQLYFAENNGAIDVFGPDATLHPSAFRNVIINQFYRTKEGSVLAATDLDGLLEMKNGKLSKPQQSYPDSTYNDIVELTDSLFIGAGNGSVRVLNKRFELVVEIKQRHEIMTLKIFRDSKNRIWIGSSIGLTLLSVNQPKTGEPVFSLLPAPFQIPALQNSDINDMLEDARGNLWIATSHGLVKIKPGGHWQLFLEKDGLPSAYISCLFQDREQNIWIGTTLGVAKLVTRSDINVYNVEDGSVSKGIGLLLPVSNELFMTSTEMGMHLFDTRSELFLPVATPGNAVYGYVKNSNPLLFYNSVNHLGRYDPVQKRISDSPLPGPLNGGVFCSLVDSNGIIFNGTQYGLVAHFKNNYSVENSFSSSVFTLHIDQKGYLWAGTRDSGLFRIEYSIMQDKVKLTVKDLSYLLPDKSIRCMFEDHNGNIWVGTRYEGAVQIKTSSNGEYTAVYFGSRQGMSSGWIRVIAEDADNCIWIASTLGMDKLIPSGDGFRIFNFSRINNFFASIAAILPQKDHSIWVTSERGLVKVVDGENERSPALPVFITSVQLGDSAVNFGAYPAGRKLGLQYNQNQLRFEFSAPGFINEKQVFYSYRLLGSEDTNWSKAANLHNVSYASLQPGNYHFEVRTLGWNEAWGEPAHFEFVIKPPYWRTWWFYSLIGLAALLLFYAFYRYRIRHLLKLQNVRNSIASDLHDDIGATLTNINMLSEISRKNLDRPKEAEKFLERISEEVTASSQALNDIIWSVNSENDSMEELLSRMRRYAAELFDNSNTLCHLELDEATSGKKINMEERRDVYLIYKEAMNNILKHSSAANIWISAQCNNGKFQLRIKDDGKGFDPTVETNRNGLKNIRSRVAKWKGSATINSAPGNGAVIEITMPLTG